ncbi:MAG: hypothetical protein NZ533_12520, partial [Casimicrobiaceae bacterium]|nr:hypothetical protein [Casimicrobiaceae bacterium]
RPPTAAPSGVAPTAPASSGAFLALDPGHWALQLALAASEEALPRPSLAETGIELYALTLAVAGERRAVLLAAPYPTVEAARAAAARLSARLGHAVWPRRIGPLQNELRMPRGGIPGPP